MSATAIWKPSKRTNLSVQHHPGPPCPSKLRLSYLRSSEDPLPVEAEAAVDVDAVDNYVAADMADTRDMLGIRAGSRAQRWLLQEDNRVREDRQLVEAREGMRQADAGGRDMVHMDKLEEPEVYAARESANPLAGVSALVKWAWRSEAGDVMPPEREIAWAAQAAELACSQRLGVEMTV